MLTTDELNRLTAWVRKAERAPTREEKLVAAKLFLEQVARRHPERRVRRLP